MSGRPHLVRWAYAMWAALVATPIAWVLAGGLTGSPIKPGTLVLIGGAFVAARAAAGRAARAGTSSHGAAAATLTYAGGLAAIVPITWIAAVVSSIIDSKPLMPVIVAMPATVPFALIFAVGASIIVLPACMIGTLLFSLPLFLIDRVRRRQHSRAPQSFDCGGAVPPL